MNVKSTGKLVVLVLACTLLMMIAGCKSEPALAGTISEDGSLNVQPLAEKLAASFIDRHPQVSISIKGSSTNVGIEAVNAGAVDIGGASRDLKPSEPKLVTYLLAKDGIAIIVHPSNPVTDLTQSQIRDILAGKIFNWRQVGGVDLAILVVTREEATSTRSIIEERLMGENKISTGAIVKLANEEQKQVVLGDPRAIGYNPFATSLDGSVKALSIEGITAAQDNARNNIYPLVRPLYFLTKTGPSGVVKAFIDYCLGAEGQKLVADLGYIPAR